jgi:hypothetical protein
MLNLRLVRTALVAALLGLALIAPSAWAVWTDSEVVSPSGQSAREPNTVADGNGNALLVWARSDGANYRVQARRRSADGTLSPVQTLSTAGQNPNFIRAAMNANGDAYIVWGRSDGTNQRIEGRARSAAGVLSPVQTLSSAGQDAARPDVGIAANGDAVVVWQRSDGTTTRVQARTRFANGTISGVAQNMSNAGVPSNDARVAVDPAGNAVVVWEAFDGTIQRVQVGARSAAGVVTPAQYASAAGQQASSPQVAIDPSGNAAFVWEQLISGEYRVQTRSRSSAGTISSTQTLSNAGVSSFQPQVSMDPGGNAVFVWTDGRIELRTRTSGGAFTPKAVVSPAGTTGSEPYVGSDTAGNAVVAWRSTDFSNVRIAARRRTSAGAFGSVQVISPAGFDAFTPRLAVSGNGLATAIWQQDENNGFTDAQASGGP